MQYPKLIVVGLLVSFAGCGGDRGTGPLSESQAREICRDTCEYDADCGEITESEIEACVTSCGTDGAGFIREDAGFAFSECLTSLACDAQATSCFEALEPLEVHHRWEERCGVQLTEACGEEFDDLCNVDPVEGQDFNSLVVLAAPVIVEEMIACLDQPDCAARTNCVGEVIDDNLDDTNEQRRGVSALLRR